MTGVARPAPTREDLVRELGQVRERGIIRVESPAHKRKLELSLLRRCVLIFAGPEKSFVSGLEELMRVAIGRLPDGLLKTAGTIIYGLDRDFTDAKPDAWRAEALKLFGVKDLDDFRKREEVQVLTLIAAEIEILTVPRRRTRAVAGASIEGGDSYIRRQVYHDRFSQLVAAGATCIVLAGLPGIGKTWLAEALVAEHLEEDQSAPLIRMRGGKLNPQDMRDALASVGSHAEPRDVWLHPEAYLTELLCSDPAPSFVIFDNLDEFAELDKLLPRQTTSIVVATCRTTSPTTRSHEVVPVGLMEVTEATQLVIARLPRLKDDQAQLFAQSLDGYPILIHIASALYRLQPTSVAEFSTSIEAGIHTLAETTYIDAGEDKRLLVILGRLLNLLREESQLAVDLLSCMAFIDSAEIDLPFAEACLDNRTGQAVQQVALLHALDMLSRYSLLEVWIGRISFSRYHSGEIQIYGCDYLRVHSLIRRLMQHFLVDQADSVHTAAAHVFGKALIEMQREADRHGLTEHMFDSSFGGDGRSQTDDTATGYYERLQRARVHIRTLQVQAQLLRIIEATKQNPGMKMGAVVIVFYMPGLPLDIVDLDAQDRPHEGLEVELLGYRFNLINEDIERSYTLDEFKERLHYEPTFALSLKVPTTDTGTPKMVPVFGTKMLLLDQLLVWRQE